MSAASARSGAVTAVIAAAASRATTESFATLRVVSTVNLGDGSFIAVNCLFILRGAMKSTLLGVRAKSVALQEDRKAAATSLEALERDKEVLVKHRARRPPNTSLRTGADPLPDGPCVVGERAPGRGAAGYL